MIDPIGARMKVIERAWAGLPLDPQRLAYARIDGRGFSRFTRGLRKPFDARMSTAMERTPLHLLEASQARTAYVQSDEISLLWAPAGEGSELFFGGKPQKMVSVLAGKATAALTRALLDPALDPTGEFAGYADRLPHLDARVMQLEDAAQAAEAFAWRGADARRNAVSGLARTVFSHREVQNRSTGALLEMLDARGVRLDAEDTAPVNGVLLRTRRAMRELVDVLHGFLARGDGKLSKRALRKEFSALTAEEVAQIETAYEMAFPERTPREGEPVDRLLGLTP